MQRAAAAQARHRCGIYQRPMLRRLSLELLASAISIASLPAIDQENETIFNYGSAPKIIVS